MAASRCVRPDDSSSPTVPRTNCGFSGVYVPCIRGGPHWRQSAPLAAWYFVRASFESSCARLTAASASSLRRSGETWPAVVIMIGARPTAAIAVRYVNCSCVMAEAPERVAFDTSSVPVRRCRPARSRFAREGRPANRQAALRGDFRSVENLPSGSLKTGVSWRPGEDVHRHWGGEL